MDNYFEQMVSDNMITESAEEVITEATMLSDTPYLKLNMRKSFLPIGRNGNAPTNGCMCFLYTNSFKDSLNIINDKKSFDNKNKYIFYYYPWRYVGRLYNRTYRILDKNVRKDILDEVASSSKVKPYRQLNIQQSEYRNIYIDLHKYLNIFNDICKNIPISKYVGLYWNYIKSILSEYDRYPNYSYRYIIIDMSRFPVTGKTLKDNISNPIYMMYYSLYKFFNLISDINIDFYFINGPKSIRINPSQCNDKSFREFKPIMVRLLSGTHAKNLEDSTSDDVILKDELKNDTATNILDLIDDKHLLSPDEDSTTTKEIKQKLDQIVTKVNDKIDSGEIKIKDVSGSDTIKINTAKAETLKQQISPEAKKTEEKILKDAVKSKVEDEVDEDKDLIAKIYKEINKNKVPKTASTARDEMLKQKQEELVVGNMTIKDLEKIKGRDIKLIEKDVSNKVDTQNKNVTNIRFENFDKEYNEKLLPKDIVSVFTSFDNKKIPLYVLSIEHNDTSTELDYKETYTVKYEDANRKRHTITVDIPKLFDDKFIFIGGNKKMMKWQNFFLPVVKIKEDTVEVVTNYNKIIIVRNDRKSQPSVERFKKILNKNEELNKLCTFGYSYASNTDVITTLEYDALSKILFKFANKKTVIYFLQKDAKDALSKKGLKEKEGKLFIGFENDNPIYIDINTQTDDKGRTIVDIIIDNSNDSIKEEYLSSRPPKTNSFAYMRVMGEVVKVGIMLAFWDGFSTFIKKLGIEYRLENKIPSELSSDENFIKFADCVFVYKADIGSSLLLNGFGDMNTETINIADMDNRDAYFDYIMKRYNRASVENILINYCDFLIDPITREVLIDHNMPTDTVSLIIYAVRLLADSQFIPEINQSLSRIRRNEIIPAVLYKELANRYSDFTSNGRVFSIPRNAVISAISALPTIENFSVINPYAEMHMASNISAKGHMGVNEDRSFTLAKRSYDNSMIGIISPSTPPDGNVGVSKSLALEPSVTNIRGYVDINQDKLDKLKDVNVFSAMELLVPLGEFIDDPTRLGHSMKGPFYGLCSNILVF